MMNGIINSANNNLMKIIFYTINGINNNSIYMINILYNDLYCVQI